MFAVDRYTQKMEARVIVFDDTTEDGLPLKSVEKFNFNNFVASAGQRAQPEKGIYISITHILPYGHTFDFSVAGREKVILTNLPNTCWTPLTIPIAIKELVVFTLHSPCRLLVNMIGAL